MKKTQALLFAGIAAIGLAGCAGSPDSRELSQQTVEYGCGPGGEQPLTVQYTFQGQDALSARIVHMNQAIDMTRVTSSHADMVGNTFRGGGYTWITDKFDIDDVDEVDGNMLTQDAPAPATHGGAYSASSAGMHASGHTGQAGMVGTVLLRDCRVN